MKKLLTRVYEGGDHNSNHQRVAFTAAWANHELSNISDIQFLSHKQVKENNWRQDEIFKWLLVSDIHIILCHIHQGEKFGGAWDCSEYILNLLSLEFHLGIPMGEYLRCPIFTQNRISYIYSLPERINYTLAIAMNNFFTHFNKSHIIYNGHEKKIFRWQKSDDVIEELKRRGFGQDHKWVLKFPFRTHSFDQKYCNNFEDLRNQIEVNYNSVITGSVIPYGIIQPRLSNRYEYKVVLLDGKANFFLIHNPEASTSKAFCPTIEDKKKLFAFAEDSLRELKFKQPGTIDCGLVRVDIMINEEGKMIVNEFESFEALFAKNWKCDLVVMNCLQLFWESQLTRLLQFV